MTEYETKTFAYSEDGPGRYVIMATKLPADTNRQLESVGLSGEMVLFSRPVDGSGPPTNDVYKFTRRFVAEDDSSLNLLLRHIQKGNWEKLGDGMVYSPPMIEGMV